MYAPLGQPRKTINWRFCVMEGLIRTLLLIVTCSAFFSSFSYVMEQKTKGYELATCTVVEALVKEELCVVKSSIHTCYSAQWKVSYKSREGVVHSQIGDRNRTFYDHAHNSLALHPVHHLILCGVDQKP